MVIFCHSFANSDFSSSDFRHPSWELFVVLLLFFDLVLFDLFSVDESGSIDELDVFWLDDVALDGQNGARLEVNVRLFSFDGGRR